MLQEWLSVATTFAALLAALASGYLVLYVRATVAELRDEYKEWATNKFRLREACETCRAEIFRRLGKLEETKC